MRLKYAHRGAAILNLVGNILCHSEKLECWSSHTSILDGEESLIISSVFDQERLYENNVSRSSFSLLQSNKMSPTNSWNLDRDKAIYLNNVGCALLEQGAFENAMDTFRDAVAIMKTVCMASTQDEVDLQSKMLQNIHDNPRLSDCIQRANQRLAVPQRCQIVPSMLHDATLPVVVFLHLEDYEYFEFDAHIFLNPHHTLLCPIYIEDSTTSDIDSGTMLYNLAISYTCLAKCQPITANRAHLNQAAVRLFELTDSILQRCASSISSTGNDGSNDDQCMQQHVASVNIAVLHGLLQLMVSTTEFLQVEDDFEQVLDRLCTLQHTAFISSETDDYLFCTRHLPAPAA